MAQRRKVEERRATIHLERYQSLFRIGDGGKLALFELLVALLDLIALRLPKFVQLIGVFLNGVGEVREIVRQEVRISQAHHDRSDGLRQRTAVAKIRVGEMGVPVEIVVDGVVNAAPVVASVSKIERRDAEVIEKRRVIRARAERRDA